MYTLYMCTVCMYVGAYVQYICCFVFSLLFMEIRNSMWTQFVGCAVVNYSLRLLQCLFSAVQVTVGTTVGRCTYVHTMHTYVRTERGIILSFPLSFEIRGLKHF